jgi:uncharacterized membrane protein
MFTKIRPQVMAAILCGTAFAITGLLVGAHMGAVEVVTAVIGSLFGFLAGVSLKVLESSDG